MKKTTDWTTKKPVKKLALKKSTVRELTPKELEVVAGASPMTYANSCFIC